MTPAITFYLNNRTAVERMQGVDADEAWAMFHTGPQVWIGQTYCRLAAAGMPVHLTAKPPTTGIVVVHRDDIASLIAAQPILPSIRIIGVRADRDPHAAAEVEIVQNGAAAGGKAVHIPHWPQPGLIVRSPDRGSEIKTAVFKGSDREIHAGLHDAKWVAALRDLGIEWVENSAAWRGGRAIAAVNWNDYSEADLLIALRKPQGDFYRNKPASKLVNAWLAGVPAILGPEIAFRELRRTSLDYIEATTPAEAIAAVTTLKENPALYTAMVTNGRKRAADFTATAIVGQWRDMLLRLSNLGPLPLSSRLVLSTRGLRQRLRR